MKHTKAIDAQIGCFTMRKSLFLSKKFFNCYVINALAEENLQLLCNKRVSRRKSSIVM